MTGRKYGYARVSSSSQNLDRQIIALKEYVEDTNIIVDKKSGKNLEREGYQALKGPMGLRRGDSLYVVSLDRLSRSKQDILSEVKWFKDSGIDLRILDLPTTMIDFPEGQEWIRDMINNILIEVLGSIAEQERITIRKRQRAGIEAAKKKGKHLGRYSVAKPENYDDVMKLWKTKNITAVEAMKRLGVTKTLFYKWAKEMEDRKS
jgi:DNA invertase Pin-like site-specific DNA recombinase